MSLDLAARKRILLAVAGPGTADPDAAAFAVLDQGGRNKGNWLAIDAMAAQHRLHPWLHHRRRTAGESWPVPETIADGWQSAYRNGAIGALTAQAALLRLARAFADDGVPLVALKGAWLAFFAYPEAALRPMRDLDILVAADDLPRALDAMARAGCAVPEDREAAIARALDGDKHVAPIMLPDCDRAIELHHRIAEPGLPCIATEAILADARTAMLGERAIGFPSPEHMLGHLVLHAAYNHRFDCGPLALIDIAMLARAESIDATAFRALAEAGGWLPGAQLVLALVDRHMGPTGLAIGQNAVPDAIMANSETLVLQDFGTRAQVKLASEGAREGLGRTLAARLQRGLARPQEGGRMRWLASRAARTIRQGSDSRARAEASAGAALAEWLERT